MIDTIPSHVVRLATHSLLIIQRFHEAIAQCREAERLSGQPGRYEWAYRTDHEAQALERCAWLAQFAAIAQDKGIDPKAVYAALMPGSRDTLEPWSDAARAWQR
jgi:hypothetical protein